MARAETVDDWNQGIPLAYTRELADYWANEYDWRAREAALNRFDQFTTEIDGLDIHFIHQRSSRDDAFPLLITHGWPGSIVEFHKVIEPLTAAGFDVVCPSLPGYGFSGKPASTGWGIEKVAQAWDTLMGSLGYDRFGAQGGDWGAAVTTQIGRNGGRCAAIHVNMPLGFPPGKLDNPTDEETQALEAGEVLPATGTRATRNSSPHVRRPSATAWWILRSGSWRGSSRSSGRGWTATATPRTCSPKTSSSTT